jgi:uncharacterized damage-inducible protein DinB
VNNHFASLIRHQIWADAALLSAVHVHPAALADQWMLKTLHHIVFVQQFFLALTQGAAFDPARAMQPPASFAELVALYRSTAAAELAFVEALTPDALDRRFELAFLQSQPTVAEGLTQTVLHSQNHRGQCLTRLRELGAKPPTLDFILWAKDRPAPAWPELLP